MNKKIGITIVAGALALSPALANAYTGVLVSCSGGTNSLNATVSPGLTCANVKNTIKVKSSKQGFFNCAATAPAGNWDIWKNSGKFGSKVTSANAALIAKADVDVTGLTFGSCNFGGDGNSGNSSKPFGTGTVQFYDASTIKIKDGVSKFSARIAGDLATTSAQVIGIVTAGPGSGGTVIAQVPLDINSLLNLNGFDANQRLFQCNVSPGYATYCASSPFGSKDNDKCTAAGVPTSKCAGEKLGGYGCKGPGDPYVCCSAANAGNCVGPASLIPLVTNGGFIQISYDSNGDCTADGTPYTCCTGSGTGKCN